MLQKLKWKAFQDKGIDLYVHREDLNHPFVSGNKLYKLTPLLADIKAGLKLPVVSFGGPYSNHLHALAWLCHQQEIPSIAIVRGQHHRQLSATLQDARQWGMQLHPVSKAEYRQWCTLPMEQAQQKACELFGPCYLIPEGGATIDVVQAYQPIVEKIYSQLIPDYLFCPTGTGSTLAGLYWHAQNSIVRGIQCVAEGSATMDRIRSWFPDREVDPDLVVSLFHRGGFAKADESLLAFCEQFRAGFNIPIEPVYSAKMCLGVYQLLQHDYFKPGSSVVMVHTGGLQGYRGFQKQLELLDLSEFPAERWQFH